MLAPFTLIAQDVEEVIVTANKKEETVMEIPMNISVITEATLDERGILNPEDYLRSIAGVSTPGGSNYYTFRGLNTSTSQRSSGTTSTYVDEINGSLMNLFDVQRVEVLRGPQGTLYGSNAIGGTIRYITNKPDSSGSYGKVRVGYGNKRLAEDPETTVEAMYNMPLSDTIALRAVYSQVVSPGIYKNIQTGKTVGEEDDQQLMLTLGIDDGRLNGFVRYYSSNNKAFGILEPGQSKPGSADVYVKNCPEASSWWYNFDGDPTCSRLSAISLHGASEGVEGVLTDYNPMYSHALAADETEEVRTEMVSATFNYDFDVFDAIVVYSDRKVTEDATTDWARIDMDDYVPAPLIVDGDQTHRKTTEVRFSSKPGQFEWNVGYYHYEWNEEPNQISQTQYAMDQDWLDYVTSIAAGITPADYDATAYCPPFCEGHLGYPYLYYASYTEYNEEEEKSYFGQFDYHVNDKLTLTYGIRDYELSDASKSYQYGIFYMGSYDEDGIDGTADDDVLYGGGTGCDGTDPVGTDCSELSGSESDTRQKFAITYQLNDDLTVYTTRAAGYRPGGNQSPLPPFCSSDETAQETWAPRYNSDEAETTELGVKARGENYSANVTYFEVDWDGIIISVTPGCGWSYNFNGGKAKTSGWEYELTYDLTDTFSLDFTGSNMTAVTSIDIDSLGAEAGDRLPNTVENQWNFGATYETVILTVPSQARVDVNYYGDSFNTFAENPNSSSPEYTKVNFNLGMDINANARLQLSVDNLFDKRTAAYIYAVDDTSWRPRNWMQWIPPRTVSVKYTYNF
jgi:outer membrane receptor protein involved in Fe transport